MVTLYSSSDIIKKSFIYYEYLKTSNYVCKNHLYILTLALSLFYVISFHKWTAKRIQHWQPKYFHSKYFHEGYMFHMKVKCFIWRLKVSFFLVLFPLRIIAILHLFCQPFWTVFSTTIVACFPFIISNKHNSNYGTIISSQGIACICAYQKGC